MFSLPVVFEAAEPLDPLAELELLSFLVAIPAHALTKSRLTTNTIRMVLADVWLLRIRTVNFETAN